MRELPLIKPSDLFALLLPIFLQQA